MIESVLRASVVARMRNADRSSGTRREYRPNDPAELQTDTARGFKSPSTTKIGTTHFGTNFPPGLGVQA